MPEKYKTLLLEAEEGILTISLNRPDSANALNTEMAIELKTCFSSANNYKCIILTSKSDKVFCAGADLKEREGMDLAQWKEQHKHFEALIESILSLEIPIICSANGAAFGGGLEILLACDFAYAASGSKMSFSEVGLGIMPGLGGIYRLQKLVGPARARELVSSARVFSSEEAYSWGIINEVYKRDELAKEVLGVAKRITQKAPLAVKAAKKSTNYATEKSFSDWSKLEHELYYQLVQSEDRKEGVSAFVEKREPKFKGK